MNGQLKTNCKNFQCFEIENVKREMTGIFTMAEHEMERSTKKLFGSIVEWRETHYFTIGSGKTRGYMEIHFTSKATPSPTTRTFSAHVTFQGKNFWSEHPDSYKIIKGILEEKGFKFELEKCPFREEKTREGALASRKMEENIKRKGWPVKRNF